MVIVEGQTEESFVNDVLAPALWLRELLLTPILLGVPGQKGGRTNYARVRKDILLHLKQDKNSYCSTMLDYYGLGVGFPGTSPSGTLSNSGKVRHIEAAIQADMCAQVPELRPDLRLLPYLQLHEYEALLFSDPAAFANGINHSHLAGQFSSIRDRFPNPEDINDNPETAPSKRILKIYPGYRKVIDGSLAARAVTVEKMRESCPHFRDWLDRLSKLQPL